MFRSILCIREPLNHAATNTSIDINLCMIEVSQRQAELLLLRKMITKDIFQYCLVTLSQGHQLLLRKSAFDFRLECQTVFSAGEGRVHSILCQVSKSFLNIGQGASLDRNPYRVFPFCDFAIRHGIQGQVQRPIEPGLLFGHRGTVRNNPVIDVHDPVDPSWRPRSILEDAKITIENFPFQIGIGFEGSVCLGSLVSQFQARHQSRQRFTGCVELGLVALLQRLKRLDHRLCRVQLRIHVELFFPHLHLEAAERVCGGLCGPCMPVSVAFLAAAQEGASDALREGHSVFTGHVAP